MRSAMRWLLEREDYEAAAVIASSLRWFWVITREITEGSEWLDLVLDHRKSLTDLTLARVLNGAGLMGIRSIDFERAEVMWRESLAVYEKLGDDTGIARQTYHLATLAWFEDDLDAARALIVESEQKSRAIGDTWAMAWSMAVGGTMARARGDLPEARRLLTESHEALMSVTGTLDQGWSHLRLGALARDEGDYAEATTRFSTGRDLLVYADDLTGVTHANAGLGAMAWLSGDHQYALDLYRSVVDGFSLSEDASNNLFELKTMIQSNPSTDELKQVVESNRERATREGDRGPRTALAEYIYHVGKTAHRQGQHERARAALVEALYLYRTAEEMPGVANSLAALASSAHARGEMEMAARLFGLSEWYAISDGVQPWPPAEEPKFADQIAEARAALGGEQFVKETIEGEGLTLEDAMKLSGLPER
jgi:tetratricopeptide (TPR) repeat protein